jgi:hypothetical protein
MANTTLTADIVAKASLAVLDNNLGFLDTFHRELESEFTQSVNGYKPGATIRMRRPADFTVRSGAVMSVQDVIEGRLAFTVDKQKGIDFNFTSTDLTLSVEALQEKVIEPAIIRLVNEIGKDCLDAFYKGTYHWAGTPGQTINSFADFSKGPERLDEMAVPQDGRTAILSPTDHWAMLGSQTALYINDAAKSAYRNGELGQIAGVKMFSSAVVPTHTTGSRDDTTPITAAASGDQSVTYDSVKNTWAMDLVTTGFDNATTLVAGDVFTIADLYAVNPVTKQATNFLQPFVVNTAITLDSTDTINISPPIITSGPHQTVALSTGTFASNALVNFGAASTGYKQNLIYHKNAYGLAFVPMELPSGAVNPSRVTSKKTGISIRVIPAYDATNDVSAWRLDVLYGRQAIDPRIASRLSGTA